ncbi:MAG: flavin reductase [Micromonosporaceae bacterium]|nr:flavin reductase [Micromonosporaceae bacterium]
MSIHYTDPFATPEPARSPVRRLRGRMPAPVTVWTAYGTDDRPAGLTVSSTVVVDGDPGVILGLVDEESDLYAAALASGRIVVMVLREGENQLADRFAGLLPAPGGPFADGGWERTEYGPVRAGARTWAGCRVVSTQPVGYARLVQASVDTIHLDDAGHRDDSGHRDGTGRLDDVRRPLVHYRGRYVRLAT